MDFPSHQQIGLGSAAAPPRPWEQYSARLPYRADANHLRAVAAEADAETEMIAAQTARNPSEISFFEKKHRKTLYCSSRYKRVRECKGCLQLMLGDGLRHCAKQVIS